jgi:hypothetical protein
MRFFGMKFLPKMVAHWGLKPDAARVHSDIQHNSRDLEHRLEDRRRRLARAYEEYLWVLSWADTGLAPASLKELLNQGIDGDRELINSLDQATRQFNTRTRDALRIISADRMASGRSVYATHDGDRANRRADVVFIHGLHGDAFETWCHDPRRLRDSWPYWLAADPALGSVGIWSLGYAAASSKWRGSALPLSGIAQTAIHSLEGKIGGRPLVFIVHSLGGLVVKKMVRRAWDYSDVRAECRVVRESLRGIVFLATPHAGALLGSVVDRLGVLYGATAVIESLRKNDSEMREVGELFAKLADMNRDIKIRSYYETEKYMKTLVVDEASANPGISHVESIPVPGKNHIDICKCKGQDDTVYREVREFILRIIESDRSTVPS